MSEEKYLRNRWYVAAWAHELDHGPLGRTILDEPVVFFRTEDRTPAALEDSCAHRYMPLSRGRVTEGCIECPYHGLVYDATGACVAVPGQTQVPPEARVRTYPVAERHRWIWIWPGDPAQADPATIPDFHWNDDPAWVSLGDYFHVKGSWRLLVDNLLDLSHVAYVHSTTLGTDRVADFPVKVRRGDGVVHVDRWILGEPPPPMFAAIGDFEGPVDRWQLTTYTPPGHFVIDVGCADAGTGAQEGDRSEGIEMVSNHTVTPETATTSHYFWHHARNFRLDEPTLTSRLAQSTRAAFGEDVVIIEAQQQRMNQVRADKPVVDINADAGVMQGRRLLDELIAAEG